MKILGGLYTTGGVHTHTLAPILKNDTDSQHTKQEQSKPLKSQLTTKVCFAHAFLPTLKKDYVI